MKWTMLCLMVLLAFGTAGTMAAAAEVSQGKCITYDREKGVITMEEYDINFSAAAPYGQPTGRITAYQAGKALIGLPPEPGDILRIAYKTQGDAKVALKVMNVSKQDLRKK